MFELVVRAYGSRHCCVARQHRAVPADRTPQSKEPVEFVELRRPVFQPGLISVGYAYLNRANVARLATLDLCLTKGGARIYPGAWAGTSTRGIRIML